MRFEGNAELTRLITELHNEHSREVGRSCALDLQYLWESIANSVQERGERSTKGVFRVSFQWGANHVRERHI